MNDSISWRRDQSLGEEIANSVSHGVGFLAAVAITPVMIVAAIPSGAAAVVGASIFGATMMMLYLSSTLYHAFPNRKTKRVFQIFDHGAIFLLIAGTYTPFTLTVLQGAWGWTLFGIVWGLAILGVVLKSVGDAGTSKLSIALYLGMGWMAVLLHNRCGIVYQPGEYFGWWEVVSCTQQACCFLFMTIAFAITISCGIFLCWPEPCVMW